MTKFTFPRTSGLFCKILLVCVVAGAARAEAPRQSPAFPIDEVIGQMSSSLKADKRAARNLELARFLKMVGVKEVKSDLRTALASHMREDPEWKKPISSDARVLLAKLRLMLEKHYKEESYESAWIADHLGEKDKAKATLRALFDKEHDKITKMKESERATEGRTSLGIAAEIYAALAPRLSATERTALDDRMKDLKAKLDPK